MSAFYISGMDPVNGGKSWRAIEHPVVRRKGPTVYELQTLPIRLVRAGDVLWDARELGSVVKVAEVQASHNGRSYPVHKIWFTDADSDVFADQEVRVMRPRAVPEPVETAPADEVTTAQPVLTQEEWRALGEVFYRHIGGSALAGDTPLGQVINKLEDAGLMGRGRTPTMVNTNKAKNDYEGSFPHTVLEMIEDQE